MNRQEDTLFKTLDEEKIQLSFPEEEAKYNIQIYPSKNKKAITFKIEEINFFSHYFYLKLDYNDFNLQYKGMISTENIEKSFCDIKNIINTNKINLQKCANKIYLIIRQDINNTEIVFKLKKKVICQNKINQMLTEKINNNLKCLKEIEIQMDNLSQSDKHHNILINNINDKIANINNTIKNLYDDINNINKEVSINEQNIKLNDVSFVKRKENKTNKRCQSCSLLCLLNIISFILIFNFIKYFFFVQNEIDISIQQEEELYKKFPFLDKIFALALNNFDFSKKNQTVKFEKNNSKNETDNEYNNHYFMQFFKHDEALDIIKRLNIIGILIDEKINLMSNDSHQKEESIKYFRNQISEIKDKAITDVNLLLKYSKMNLTNNFYNNFPANKENLICVKLDEGNIIYIFSINIIKLMDDITNKNLKKENKEVIYIFKNNESCEDKISDEEKLINIFNNILELLNNYEGVYKGNILDIQIYEVKYKLIKQK